MASITEINGKYFLMVSTGYDCTGKQIRKTMTYKPEPGMTQKQIEKTVNEQAVMFEKKVLSGQILDGSVTFADFSERWMRDYEETLTGGASHFWQRRLSSMILSETSGHASGLHRKPISTSTQSITSLIKRL